MVKPGRPLETWISTETGCPRAPLSVAEATVASMWENGRLHRLPIPDELPGRGRHSVPFRHTYEAHDRRHPVRQLRRITPDSWHPSYGRRATTT